jgi:hypothetical protein
MKLTFSQPGIQETKETINLRELKLHKGEPIIVLFESFEVKSHFTSPRSTLVVLLICVNLRKFVV